MGENISLPAQVHRMEEYECYQSTRRVYFGYSILLIFFIRRELVCWYWKINARLATQKDTAETLKISIERNEVYYRLY